MGGRASSQAATPPSHLPSMSTESGMSMSEEQPRTWLSGADQVGKKIENFKVQEFRANYHAVATTMVMFERTCYCVQLSSCFTCSSEDINVNIRHCSNH